jgi:hypothetical protein
MKYLLIISTAFLILFSSCKKENTQPEVPVITKSKLGEAITSQNLKAILWSDDTLATGFRKLYISLTDASGNVLSNANISIATSMQMPTMMHSSPSEQPIYNSLTKLYEFASVFTMASGTDSWTLKATINGEEKLFPIYVRTAKTKVVGSYVGSDSKKYVVTLIPLKKWEVGLNDVEILVNKMADMMNFPPENNLSIEMTPEMPSMGHGSPNNVNPTFTSNGHYKGKVNYTMTGDWRLHFKISKGGVELVNDAFIDILF